MVSMATRRSLSGNGKGRSRIPSTKVKMAVVAPIPKARVMMADAANPGLRRSWRMAKVRSETNVESTQGLWQRAGAVDRVFSVLAARKPLTTKGHQVQEGMQLRLTRNAKTPSISASDESGRTYRANHLALPHRRETG